MIDFPLFRGIQILFEQNEPKPCSANRKDKQCNVQKFEKISTLNKLKKKKRKRTGTPHRVSSLLMVFLDAWTPQAIVVWQSNKKESLLLRNGSF